MLESPTTAGGDTLVSSSVRAYSSLSPRFRKRLEGLTAIHTNNDGVSQELKHGQQAVMRRGVLQAEHPVVLVHPVTKQKALCKFTSDMPTYSYSFSNSIVSRCKPSLHKEDRRVRAGGVGLHPQIPFRSHRQTTGFLLSDPL